MMKCHSILLTILGVVCVVSSAGSVRNGIHLFYQQGANVGVYTRLPNQAATFVQYQPYTDSRSKNGENGGTAFASGNRVAAGAYVQEDCDPSDDSDKPASGQTVVNAAADDGEPIPLAGQDETFEPQADQPGTAQNEKPSKQFNNNAGQDDDDDNDDDDDADDENDSPFVGKIGPIPSNTFFPVNIGRTNGRSAISIANSFSTGKKSAAISRATSYGSAKSR